MPVEAIRVYGDGPHKDEGGKSHMEERPVPPWVIAARKRCAHCHDNFYNGRANCTGNSWCWSLQKGFARRKTRPSCYH